MKSEYLRQIENIILESKKSNSEILKDYFSWGRDKRHVCENSDTGIKTRIKQTLTNAVKKYRRARLNLNKHPLSNYPKYLPFEKSYNLMSDEQSKKLFCEIILTNIYGEGLFQISTFTEEFINSYEKASSQILESEENFKVYKWQLKKISLNESSLFLYTAPTLLSLINIGRLYRYESSKNIIEVEEGDIIIDAGVGWGDTSTYMANICGQKDDGHLYAFDIVPTALEALKSQLNLNPSINNLTPVHKALFDCDNKSFFTTDPSPGARVVNYKTEFCVKSITIDTFVKDNNLPRVDFIKMDIEGAEIPALKGAKSTINKFKPKLAISAYHIWDDLLKIPQLINEIRNDYEFYLDCTTGFGGETVLYCK